LILTLRCSNPHIIKGVTPYWVIAKWVLIWTQFSIFEKHALVLHLKYIYDQSSSIGLTMILYILTKFQQELYKPKKAYNQLTFDGWRTIIWPQPWPSKPLIHLDKPYDPNIPLKFVRINSCQDVIEGYVHLVFQTPPVSVTCDLLELD
jgi:hypothetical protein